MQTLSIEEVCRESWETAEKKGWHETPRSELELAALMMSELGEFVEDIRNRALPVHYEADGKPCGPLSELADVIIRIGDAVGTMKMDGFEDKDPVKMFVRVLRDKLEYNKTRPHRHGGKAY